MKNKKIRTGKTIDLQNGCDICSEAMKCWWRC